MPVISKKRKFLFALALASTVTSMQYTVQPCAAVTEHSNSVAITEEKIGDRVYQVTRVLVKARPEQVWNVITDYANAPSIFATLKKCQVLLDKGSHKVVRYQLRPSGLMTTFEYDLEVKEQSQKSLEWHRVSGDFKEVDGFWKLDPAECGRSTLVTYASYVNGGFFMPQALIKRQSHIDLPQVMAALKSHSERTMNIASHGSHPAN